MTSMVAEVQPRFVPTKQDFIIPSLRPPVTHDYKHPEYIHQEDFVIPLTPTPDNYPQLPYHLRKYILKRAVEENGRDIHGTIWNERALWIEERVTKLLSGLPDVDEVIRNGFNSEQDVLGDDVTVRLKDELVVHVQVKSSQWGLVRFKKALRGQYFPGKLNDEGQVRRCMTEHGIILINGSETRSDQEIIGGSFYPQLERIRAYKATEAAAA
jgi:hypothetical protein